MFFKKYLFGDTAVYYAESPVEGHDGKTTIGLAAYPERRKSRSRTPFLRQSRAGRLHGGRGADRLYAGVTMRNRAGTLLKSGVAGGGRRGRYDAAFGRRAATCIRHVLTYSPETGVFYVQVSMRTPRRRRARWRCWRALSERHHGALVRRRIDARAAASSHDERMVARMPSENGRPFPISGWT